MPRPRPHLLTAAEYLARECEAEVRHEFVAGEVYAMTGGSLAHNEITLNLAVWLRRHLANGPCRVYASDVKVHAAAADAYYYPDLLVRCGPALPDEAVAVDDPVLVVEVLSKRTQSTDLREKQAAYRRIRSVQEYLVVSQARAHAQVWRRRGDLGWDFLQFDDAIELTSVGARIAMAEVYAGTGVRV